MDRNKTNIVLAERIGKLRAQAGESQQNLADSIGVKRETVKFWESGERHIKCGDIVKLAKHFNVSADYLLGLSDVASPSTDLRGVCDYTGLSEGAIETLRRIKENDPYNDMKVLSSFLENKGHSFVGQLSLLINLIYRSKPELDEFKDYSSDNWRDLYNLCYELKLGAFSFSEYCRSIADEYGLYDLIAEAERKMTEDFHNFTLSYFDRKCKEADNGEHTEN